MKRIRFPVLLLILALLVCGCSPRSVYHSGDRIVYPGTEWNMTPWEAITALGLDDGDFTVESTDSDMNPTDGTVPSYTFSVENTQVFGADAKVCFTFLCYAGDDFGLSSIVVIYPDETDMTRVRAQMEASLGSPTGGNVEDSHLLTWDSEDTLDKYLPDGLSAEMRAIYEGQPTVRVFWNTQASLLYYLADEVGESKMVVFDCYLTRFLQN